MQLLVGDKQVIHRAEAAKRLLSQQAHHAASASELGVDALLSMQYPGIAGPQIAKVQAFEIIARVRELVADSKIKADSAKDYEKKAQHLLSMMDAGEMPCEVERWINSLDVYAGQANSFRACKAAACWYLRQKLRDLLSQQDRHQRAQEFGAPWLKSVELIAELEEVYEAVYTYTRQVPKPIQGFSLPVGESKKRDLKVIAKKYPNWVSLMREGAAGTKYVDAQRILELIGCRPEELEQGVTVTRSEPQTVTFKVHGAKVTKAAGQPWRKISVPISLLADDWTNRLHDQRSFTVKIDSKDGLRKSLQRISKRVLKGVPFATAYVYRHAFATMLRDSGHTVEEIGACMGHSVAETQRLYGFRKGGGRKVKPMQVSGYSVEVPREVRPLKKNKLRSVLA
ncbi:hypothetical protein RCH06_003597 [Polaromonas sp. CG_9.5]|uniref:site-specific integrase n=1 Tax=Polaromonas sp. CG_9.5 TaxID=3071705 RepID=UPI002DF7E575|nr:hypothetical protein [Polaromonas sp. CG_9.5]